MAKDGKVQSSRCILKGMLAGLVGGIVGAGVKAAAEKIVPARTNGQVSPAAEAIDGSETLTGAHSAADKHKAATTGLHWVFGGLVGAVYGAATEIRPGTAAWKGAAFGLTVNKLAHSSLLSGTGTPSPVAEQTAQERVSEWFSHAMYGVSTEIVRGILRKRL